MGGKSPQTLTEEAHNCPLKPHVENGTSTARTDHDQAADYMPKKDLFINKIRYVSVIYIKFVFCDLLNRIL